MGQPRRFCRPAEVMHKGEKTGRQIEENAGQLFEPRVKWRYAAALFSDFACVFVGGFELGALPAFILSLAANSCLTLAAMTAVSTL